MRNAFASLFIVFFLVMFFPFEGKSQETSDIPWDELTRFNSTPLFQQIVNELGSTYNSIGQSEANRVIEWSRDLPVNDAVPGGYLYSKGFADFGYSVSRNVVPDLMSGGRRWLVQDSTVIEIGATQLLSNLSDSGDLNLDQATIAAFAGITFRRVYSSYHFAPSFEEGLVSKLDRLFFPFLSYAGSYFKRLGPDEVMRKEDYISIKGGALVDVPLGYGFGVGAGVLSSFSRLAKSEVHAYGQEQGLRVSHEVETSVLVGGTVSLSFQFLKIIDAKLLGLDFSYEKTKKHKVHLSFKGTDYQNLLEKESDLSSKINKLLHWGVYTREVLEPYVLSEQLHEKSIMTSKYAFLFLGGLRKSETEQVRIVKDNRVESYYRHHFQRNFVMESFWKKLLTYLGGGLLRPFLGDMRDLYSEKNLRLEYQHDYDLIVKKEDLDLGEERKFSFTLGREYFSRSIKGGVRKPIRKKLVKLSRDWGVDDKRFLGLVLDGEWESTGHFRGLVEAKSEALDYFHYLEREDIVEAINKSCGGKLGDWRAWVKNLFRGCISLRKKYDRLKKEWLFKDHTSSMRKTCKKQVKKFAKWYQFSKRRRLYKACMAKMSLRDQDAQRKHFPVWRFKSFIRKLVSVTDRPEHYFLFFGRENVYIHGALSIGTKEGFPIVRPFEQGSERTLGLIEDTLIEQGARAPASVP